MPRYQSSASKAEDNRSSAYTLLAVGGIGFIVVVLIFCNVIPLYQNAGIARYLVCGVMGAMFVLFIVLGAVSMRDSRLLLVKAKSENSLRSEITKWCQDNLEGAAIDDLIRKEKDPAETLGEEELYYRRTEKIRMALEEKFMNLDEAFLDDFVDAYYQEMYENYVDNGG